MVILEICQAAGAAAAGKPGQPMRIQVINREGVRAPRGSLMPIRAMCRAGAAVVGASLARAMPIQVTRWARDAVHRRLN